MTTVTLNISGDSQEVISVIQSLAKQQEVSQAPVATEPPPVAANDAAVTSPAPEPPAHTWTAASARGTRSNVSADAQRLLDALVRAPDHQMHIDDIYSQLELDRYGLIGARRFHLRRPQAQCGDGQHHPAYHQGPPRYAKQRIRGRDLSGTGAGNTPVNRRRAQPNRRAGTRNRSEWRRYSCLRRLSQAGMPVPPEPGR